MTIFRHGVRSSHWNLEGSFEPLAHIDGPKILDHLIIKGCGFFRCPSPEKLRVAQSDAYFFPLFLIPAAKMTESKLRLRILLW